MNFIKLLLECSCSFKQVAASLSGCYRSDTIGIGPVARCFRIVVFTFGVLHIRACLQFDKQVVGRSYI